MALSFIFGASGAGKSTTVYKKLMKQAYNEPKKQFYLIVPDQFTMQTQKDLIEYSPQHGILNIDILSFGRLSFRVLEETGGNNIPVLDDTGKNLILRIVAENIQDDLSVLGAHLHKTGYIHEVKSAISEFMQYRIGQSELQDMMQYAEKRRALTSKLKDLSVVYKGFTEYIKDHYITTEESMEVLARQVGQSEKLKDSVIVFDGFTGFTPVQLRVIEQLLVVANEVTFALTIDELVNPFQEDSEQNLFSLTQKTVGQLCRCAETMEIKRRKDVYLKGVPVRRFEHNQALSHLERNIFRYPQKEYVAEVDEIKLSELSNPREETKYCARMINKLIREQGYYYRDFAVVCGDLSGYASHIRSEFNKIKIPFFIDQTNGILLNPFVEYIRSALLIKTQNFSVDAVNHFLRSGLTDFSLQDVDELDNYMRMTRIRGKSSWNKDFTKRPTGLDEQEALEALRRFNVVRQTVIEQMEPLLSMGDSVSEKVRALYAFIEHSQIQEKLLKYEKEFEEQNDPVRAREYHQIYPYIIDLLSQIDTLSGNEIMSDQEFTDLLDAGFSEMEVGTIPRSVDHIVVGDMERSRLHQIKVLFLLGVNDGNIPKQADKGGIISDIDREFLKDSKWELAPSPRQKMYIQRFYLYMNMTKPSEMLLMSYTRTGNDGKTMRPAYLINLMHKIFPKLHIDRPEEYSPYEVVETLEDGLQLLADELREAASGKLENSEVGDFNALMQIYQKNRKQETNRLIQTAFIRYQEIPLVDKLAMRLYGSKLLGSVTRVENFAACAYAHFLKYGLKLREREEAQFEAVDMGTLFHTVLAEFSEKLKENGYVWQDFPEQEGLVLLEEIIERNAAAYGNAILYDTARNQYALQRIKRIMKRTIFTLQYQLKQGNFDPEEFEMPFKIEDDQMSLVGKIDRLDICMKDDMCYVKVVDYKSGINKFDITAFHHGLQLQLMTYLHAALTVESRRHKGKKSIPAGVLYYHMDDPIVESDRELTREEIWENILQQLRLSGLVNEDELVVEMIDHTPGSNLSVLPFSRKKDNSLKANAMLTKEEDMVLMSEYAAYQIKKLGEEILKGCISLTPYERKNSKACDYCPYVSICGFDLKIPGYYTNKIPEEEKEMVLRDIVEKLNEKEEQDGD